MLRKHQKGIWGTGSCRPTFADFLSLSLSLFKHVLIRQLIRPGGSKEQRKMEGGGCEIICGAQTTLTVKG